MPKPILSAIAAILLFAGLGCGTAMAQSAPLTPEQTRAVEQLVRDTLVKNPEILLEAMQALEARQQQNASLAARAAIDANAKALFDDGVSFVAGNPKGDVTVVEFFDYRCGYCKQVHPSLLTLIKEDSEVRLVLKELPVLGPESVLASRAAVAAMEQDKGARYLAYHNAMMGFRGQLGEAEIFRLAGESGLNVARLKTDMAAPRTDQILRQNHALAEKLGIQGTPGFVVGRELIPGAVSLDTLRQLVKAARG